MLTRISHPGFQDEIARRKRLDIFDYREISKSLPKVYDEICTDNNCFGIGYSIRKYSKFEKPFINAWIEHGYIFPDSVSSLASISFTKNIFTFGSHRQSVNQKLLPHKNCFKIGPYIHYADDYISNADYKEIKNKLGRVLLVFPMHPGTGQKIQYDIEEFFLKVDSVASDFDTVLFSLFWSEVNTDYESQILRRGYKIVCSGHRFDPYFLSRQKTIIKIADATMSNGLGTNLVYCTYLKKPHWLVRQKKSYYSLNATGNKHNAFQEKVVNNISIADSLYDAFREYNDSITENQYNLCSHYFGFNEVKKPKEMLCILEGL